MYFQGKHLCYFHIPPFCTESTLKGENLFSYDFLKNNKSFCLGVPVRVDSYLEGIHGPQQKGKSQKSWSYVKEVENMRLHPFT